MTINDAQARLAAEQAVAVWPTDGGAPLSIAADPPDQWGQWYGFAAESNGQIVPDVPPVFVDAGAGAVLGPGKLPPGFTYDTRRAAWDRLVVPRGLAAAAGDPPPVDGPPADAPEEEPAGDEDEGDVPTAVALVALPTADDPSNDIGDPDHHATLCFLGDDLDDATVQAVAAAVDAWVGTDAPAPFDDPVDGVASLGDDAARVWMIGSGSSLTGLRDALSAIPEVADAMGAAEQFPTYTPHVTIGFPADGEEFLDDATETAAAEVESIGFDRLALWNAGDHGTTWNLPTGDGSDAGAPPPEGEQTAAVATGATGPEPAEMSADGDPWYGVLCPEGVLSGDGRRFAAESVTWRDLPLPLMFQEATAIGHDGAVRVGRIDSIVRDGAMIRGEGVWDTSDTAMEAKRQVETRMLRGVSVDADDYVAELVDEQGNPVSMDDLFFADPAELGTIIEEASVARICGATLVSIPAFQQAYVANGVRDPNAVEPGADEANDDLAGAAPSLVSSAMTALEPAPAAYFERPPCLDDGITALTIDGDHIYGHLAQWGTCHIGVNGVCVVPPHSASGYVFFASGVLPTTRGPVPVGQITMDTGHAAAEAAWRPAASHYDNTGCAVADVTIGEDEHGIWYSGMIRDTADPAKVRDLQAGGCLSGDWRDTGGPDLELVAALGVNVGGFPIPRLRVAASAGRQTSLVASGIVGPDTMAWRTGDSPVTAADVRRIIRDVQRTRSTVARLKRQLGRDSASRILAAKRQIGRD